MLLNELLEFAASHSKRLESELVSRGVATIYCDECGADTVPVEGGSCELCGHWQMID